MKYEHIPVMLKEALEYLDPKAGQFFIDCTLGGGGYTLELARKVGDKGRVLSIDLDKLAIDNAKLQIANHKLQNVFLIHENFKNLSQIAKDNCEKIRTERFDGLVFDLGLSSAQLQDRARGFSFLVDAPLDMAFGHKQEINERQRIKTNNDTEFIVNKWSERNLERIIKEFGEERFAKRIAGAIARARRRAPIKTTGELVKIIEAAIPRKFQRGKIHPATRTFQALRIATNNELDNLIQALPQALELLKPGGKVAVVSYHSLEDRIVKRFFRQEARDCLCPPEIPICQCRHEARLKILTKKPVGPSEEEIKKNPRARSAKMRVAEKLTSP